MNQKVGDGRERSTATAGILDTTVATPVAKPAICFYFFNRCWMLSLADLDEIRVRQRKSTILCSGTMAPAWTAEIFKRTAHLPTGVNIVIVWLSRRLSTCTSLRCSIQTCLANLECEGDG